MRFTVGINLKGEPPFQLPASYRRHIVALIKSAVKSNNDSNSVYELYYGMGNIHKIKPFTFFLSLPDSKFGNLESARFINLDKPTVELHITSNDSAFLSSIYKGMLKPNNTMTLFNYNVEFKDFYLRKVTSINSNFIKFRILSPIVIKNWITYEKKRRFKGYISCVDPEFVESIIYSINTQCRRLIPNVAKRKIDNIEIDTTECSTIKIYHYQEIISGTIGTIGIKADEEILELIYDAGLGARRNQGYGMLDIVKEGNYIYMPIAEELITNN